MAQRIDGKEVAGQVIASVKDWTARLSREKGMRPGLAVVIVGEDPASQVYVASKSRMA
jgi:methylenetetrahydrofolate dehydrogenase (NADP+)/methenyltetrahydrofolate cyclohydrolase